MYTNTNSTPEQNLNMAIAYNNLVSWKAIFGGVVIALSTSAVLGLIGLGLGFTAFLADADVLTNIGFASVGWLMFCSIASMFVGGWVTGKLTSHTYNLENVLAGGITWGIATLVTFSLMTSSAGVFLNASLKITERATTIAAQSAGSVMKAAGQVAPNVVNIAQAVAPDMKKIIMQVNEQAEPILDNLKTQADSQTSGNDTKAIPLETAKKRLKEIINSLLTADNEEAKNSAKGKAVTFLMQNLDMNEQRAQETINGWQSNYDEFKTQMSRKAEEAKNNAIVTAETASHTMGKIALITAMINLMGALAAITGSYIGNRKETMVPTDSRAVYPMAK